MSESYYRRLIFNQENALASTVSENERLRDCRGKLNARKASMSSSKPNYSKPELTSSTWRGRHADKFEDNRESAVIDSYNSLLDKVDDALDRVDTAINNSQNLLTFQSQNLQNYKSALQRELDND